MTATTCRRAALTAVLVAAVLLAGAACSSTPEVPPGPVTQCDTATPDQPQPAPSRANAVAPPLSGAGPGPHSYLLEAGSIIGGADSPYGRWVTSLGDDDAFIAAGPLRAARVNGVNSPAGFPRIVVCEYRTVEEPQIGSCSYGPSSSGITNETPFSGVLPLRTATYRYLVFEARTSRPLDRFEVPSTRRCPEGLRWSQGDAPAFVLAPKDWDPLAARVGALIGARY